MTMRGDSEISDEVRYAQGYLAGLRFALGKTEAEVTQQQGQKKADPLLIEVWRQLHAEMHHRDTVIMQVVVYVFLFLGVFGAVMQYLPEARFGMWIVGFAAIAIVFLYVRSIAGGKIKCYKAVLQVQDGFPLPDDIAKQLREIMGYGKAGFAQPRSYISLLTLLTLFWIYIGLVKVVGLTLQPSWLIK